MKDRAHVPRRSLSQGCSSVILATHSGSRPCVRIILPCSASGSQLPQQTFGRREQFIESTVRLYPIVSPIEDGDLKTHLGAIAALRRVHDAMHRRFRVLAGFQKIQRLKEHAAETVEFSHQFTKLRIFTGRQVSGILKGGVEVELKSDLDDAARPVFHIEGIMIETDLPRDDHVSQDLLAGEGSVKGEWNRHARSLIIGSLKHCTSFWLTHPGLASVSRYSCTPSFLNSAIIGHQPV